MNLFYDNAQNIYDRGMPKWSDLGVDLRGRSTVMHESFRSTQPITEFALNVHYACFGDPILNEQQRAEIERHGYTELLPGGHFD